ncbi:hypothetical protein C9426_10005 [Serratia sp. S1B]|nr:hypothetical protein C9426_10005 [Serratia sp. S1B]
MSNEKNSKWTITPLTALGLIFVTLKLVGYINWSWWWVTAPFWAVPFFVISFFVVSAMFIGLVVIIMCLGES